MSAGLGTGDFTGLGIGQPSAQPVQHAPRMGVGLLDFTGLGVGRGVARRRGGHGPKVGGKPHPHVVNAIINDMMGRRRQMNRHHADVQIAQVTARVMFDAKVNEAMQRQAAHNRCMALLLAEV